MYFLAPYTPENIKKQYLRFAKQLHPDKGGNAEEFKLMKYEHDILLKLIDTPKPNIKKRVIIKKPVRKKVHYHITVDKNVTELLYDLKKIFKY